MIAVENQTTAGALIHSDIQWQSLPMMASATILARIGRVYRYILPASFLRFAGQFTEELRPRSIMNALCKTVVVGHAVDMQVFHADDPVAIHQTAAFLVREVVPSEGDTLMYAGHSLAVLAARWCADSKFGVLTLYPCQGFFFLAEEAWVGDLFPRRQRSEGLEPDINAHWCRAMWKALGFTLHRETCVPLAGTALVDGQGFDLPTDGAMVDHLNTTYFGQADAVIVCDGKARLWERERVIAALALKAGIPWVLYPYSSRRINAGAFWLGLVKSSRI